MSRATSIAETMLDFPFASGFSTSVSAALWMTVASLAASLLLLMYTLELRLRRRLREQRRARVVAHWRTIIAEIGFPVGRPQTVVVDLTGKVPASARRVRIVTTMRIYWDRIEIGTLDHAAKVTTTRLSASSIAECASP